MTADAAVEATPSRWMHMRNPDTQGVTRTTREAFELTWSVKGWVEATDSEVAAVELTDGDVADLNKITVPELENLAVERGIDLPAGAKKAQIVEALEQAAAPQT